MASTYSIGTQSQTEELNSAGTAFERVWNVPWKVTSGPSRGASGVLQVSEENHNAEYVKEVLDAKVAQLDKIAMLGK